MPQGGATETVSHHSVTVAEAAAQVRQAPTDVPGGARLPRVVLTRDEIRSLLRGYRTGMNLYATQGVAVREFMAPGHGRADYLLFVDGVAVGSVEAKPAGKPLAGVEAKSGQVRRRPAAGVAEPDDAVAVPVRGHG